MRACVAPSLPTARSTRSSKVSDVITRYLVDTTCSKMYSNNFSNLEANMKKNGPFAPLTPRIFYITDDIQLYVYMLFARQQ